MKTAGRITTTLALLLTVYLLSYWLLFKAKWAHIVLLNPHSQYNSSTAYSAVCRAFAPVIELDGFWNVEIPTRKYLTGHWRSEKKGDFVIIGPNQECRFQLGEFASEGKAEVDRVQQGFRLEFLHQKLKHSFFITCVNLETPSSSDPEAIAYVGPTTSDPFALEILMTKHPPPP